jgi:hypothetical protein
MRRTALLAAFVGTLMLVATEVHAQLVPLSECGSAIPCNIPKGLRPADAAALSPYSRVGNGNALVGVQLVPAEGFKPEVVTRSIAEDPSERAARIFFKRNPGFAMPRTAPTPSEPASTAPTPSEPGAPEKDQHSEKKPDAGAAKPETPPATPVLPDR